MSRSLGSLAGLLAGDAHTLCTMVRLDLADGSTLAFTDHSRDLAFDLGDGAATYSAATGCKPSDVVLAAGFDVSNFEMSGPIGELVTETAVLGGRFRGAVVRLFLVNWAGLAAGYVPIVRGKVGEGRVEGREFVLEVRNATDAFNQSWGRVLSPLCTATFGKPATGCPVTRTPYPCAVTAVVDDFRFSVDLDGDHADDFFNLGAVQFLTGGLANTAEASVMNYVGATGAVELLEPLVDAPEVGDTLNLFRGCSKLLMSDDPLLPTCLTWDAVLDFRGWREVPSSKFYHKVSAPGAAYA